MSDTTIRKVQTLALLSKFVIVENSYPSGDLYELPFIKNLDSVIAVLQESGGGATQILDDLYGKTQFIAKFEYRSGELADAVDEAIGWALGKLQDFSNQHRRVNAWLTGGC